MTHLSAPFRFDPLGRTAATEDGSAWVRDLVELTLLTGPGERVNRPEFGAGLLEMVFEPGGGTLGEATQFIVRSAVQRWLQDVILIEALEVETDEAMIVVQLIYTVLDTGERIDQTVERMR